MRSVSKSRGLLDYTLTDRPVVLDVVGGHRRVGDPVVDDGVHAHRHRVSRQDLEWSERQRKLTQSSREDPIKGTRCPMNGQ